MEQKLVLPPVAMLPGDDVALYDNNIDPLEKKYGLAYIGKAPYRKSIDIKASMLGIGFETLDRDTFNPDDTYELLAESGVKWGRCQTGWLKCEKEKGVYDFAWLDAVVNNLLKIGIQPWFSVSFGNPLYTPVEEYASYAKNHPGEKIPGRVRGYVGEVPLYHGKEAVRGWKSYVAAMAKHFKGRVTHWEIWNEPNCSGFWCFKGKPPYPEMDHGASVAKCAADYVELVRISAAEIHAIIPNAKIIGVVADPCCAYVRELGASNLADHVDIFSYHLYDGSTEYYTREKVEFCKAIINKPGRKIEFWQGESGRATGKCACMTTVHPTEYSQAKFITRRFVCDLCCGAKMSSIFTVSDFANYYPNGDDQYYGIINRKEKRPKLGFYALQTMAWLFDGIELAPDLLISFTQAHPGRLASTLDYQLITGAFRRKGIPLFCAYLPENLDLSATPVTGELVLRIGEKERFTRPVIIDPIRRNVYSISHLTAPVLALELINPITFADYPLFVTDFSAFEQ